MRPLYLYLDPDDFCEERGVRSYRGEMGFTATWDRVLSTVAWSGRGGLRLWVRVRQPEPHAWSATFSHVSHRLVAMEDGWYAGGDWDAPQSGFFVLRLSTAGRGDLDNGLEFLGAVLTDDQDWRPKGRMESQADLVHSVYGSVTGRTTLTPDIVEAGTFVTFEASYIAGDEGVVGGGSVEMALTSPPWDAPQVDDPGAAGYVQASGPAGQALAIQVIRPLRPAESREHLVRIRVGDGGIPRGQRVTLTYGTREPSGPQTRVPIVPVTYRRTHKDAWYQDVVPFTTRVDWDATGQYRPVSPEHHHRLSVRAGAAAGVRLTAPSHVSVDQPLTVTVAVTDAFNNLPEAPWSGTLAVHGPLDGETKQVQMEGPVLELGPWVIRDPGMYAVRVVVEPEGWGAVSNPIEVVDAGTERVFWGDLHVHTHLSDGRGRADGCFEYARDVARLDFVSVSDHDIYMSDGQWRYLQSLTEAYHEPGRFVTFVGCESGPEDRRDGQRQIQGHRNLYTLEDQMPLYRHWNVEGPWNLDRLASILTMNPSLLAIPHHSITLPMEWRAWGSTPSVEVYSVWGSSERRDNPLVPVRQMASGLSVQEILDLGERVGFLGGGDSHDARPGWGGDHARIKSIWGELIYKTGLTGVWAQDNTREGIWDAIQRRRTFATTGERMILQWGLNQHVMGEAFTLDTPHRVRNITGRIVGTSPIQRIVLWRNGKVFWEQAYHQPTVTFAVKDASPLTGPAYYYIGVEQEGGGQGWASPIWVDVPRTAPLAPPTSLSRDEYAH